MSAQEGVRQRRRGGSTKDNNERESVNKNNNNNNNSGNNKPQQHHNRRRSPTSANNNNTSSRTPTPPHRNRRNSNENNNHQYIRQHHHHEHGSDDESGNGPADASRPLLHHDSDDRPSNKSNTLGNQNSNHNFSSSGDGTTRARSATTMGRGSGGSGRSNSNWRQSLSIAVSQATCSFIDLLPDPVQSKLQPTLSRDDQRTLGSIRDAFAGPLGDRFDSSKPAHVAMLRELWDAGHQAKNQYYTAQQQRTTTTSSYVPPQATYGSVSSGGQGGVTTTTALPPFPADNRHDTSSTTDTAAAASAPWKSEAWKQFGFQGLDPATDFRGGGVLSLTQLLYLATTSPVTYATMFIKEDYPFAVAGINVTAFLTALADLYPATDAKHQIASLKMHWQSSYSATQARVHVDEWLCAAWREARHPDRAATSSSEPINNLSDLCASPNPDAASKTVVQQLLAEMYCAVCVLVHQEWTQSNRSLMEFQSVLAKGTKKFVNIVKCASSWEDALRRLPLELPQEF